jgi:cation diffusion facilitator family transporter
MTEHIDETRVIKIALLGFFIIFVLELMAYLLTNFLVLLAESLMALSQILISAFLLISVIWSRKPADEFYMFGRGRVENVAALVSAMIIIFVMGIETFREAIPKFSTAGAEFKNIDLALTMMGLVTFAGLVPAVNILSRRAREPSIKAQLVVLLIDLGADVATISGIAIVALGYFWADSLASVIVGATMIFSGLYLFKDNVSYLIGKSPGIEFVKKVESTAKSVKGVLGVHDLKAEYVGPKVVHAGLHIDVAKGTPIEEADRIAHKVEEKINRETICKHCTIHVEPESNSKSADKRK